MRIALVTPARLPFSCGNSLLAERLRAGLAARGHEMRLFGLNDPVEEAIGFAPDIVHSLHAIKPAAWLQRLFQNKPLPWVITLTGTDYNSPQEYSTEQDLLQRQFSRACAIVVFHEEARLWVAEHFEAAAGKLFVIAQGIDIRERPVDRAAVRLRYGMSEGAFLIFMAAGIRPVKNIGFALDVYGRLRARHPECRFILAGPVIDTIEAQRILEMGTAIGGFSYIGEIAFDSVRELMAAADLYVNTSLHEGMSGAILEALAEGLPVLASNAPGNRALVRHGLSGLLAPLSDASAFTAAAEQILRDRALRQSMGRAARVFAREFSIDQEIREYEMAYKYCINSVDARLG